MDATARKGQLWRRVFTNDFKQRHINNVTAHLQDHDEVSTRHLQHELFEHLTEELHSLLIVPLLEKQTNMAWSD